MSTKITEATLTNFQMVSYAKIVPTGNLIVLAGKNESGKTSTLDGLQAALCGHNSRDIKRPIKDGHGKGSIEVHLSDGTTLVRGYTPSGSTLKGKDAAGAKFGQKDLDDRISKLGIDGRKFINMGEKEQLAALLSIVDLPFKPAELEAQKKALETERRDIGRDGAAIGDLTVNDELPTEVPSSADLIEAIRTANEQKALRADAERGIQIAFDEVASLNAKIAELTAALDSWSSTLEVRTKALSELPEAVDTTELEAELASIDVVSSEIRANNSARELAAKKAELRKQYEAKTEQIKAIEARKAEGLAQAVMPIDGMGFDDEGVLYQGVPFSRASGAKQLIVSCAMIMATDPEIRVIVIRDGNVLDTENLALLDAMAKATDFLVFIEIVADTQGDHEYYFNEGELV